MNLWAYLHGLVELDRAELLGERKPESIIDIGWTCSWPG